MTRKATPGRPKEVIAKKRLEALFYTLLRPKPSWYRFQFLARNVPPSAVQAHEEVFAGQLCRGHGQEQFPAGESAVSLFYRTDPGFQ